MTKTVIPNPTTGTPDIQVLREMRTPPQSQASSAKVSLFVLRKTPTNHELSVMFFTATSPS